MMFRNYDYYKKIFKKFYIKNKNLDFKNNNLEKDKSTGIYYFNPKLPITNNKIYKNSYFLRKIFSKRLNNFGDLLGPVIAKAILKKKNRRKFIFDDTKLLTIGSILHFADNNDHVWGSGINGKVKTNLDFDNLNIYSVRGPLTRDILKNNGFNVPEIFGDPGLLFGYFFPEFLKLKKKRKYLIIPNYNDKEFYKNDFGIKVSLPTLPVRKIILDIAQSELIISSSLHGIVLADSLGINSIILKSFSEDSFKYKDYLLGTGREKFYPVNNISDALKSSPLEKPVIDYKKIIDSFPLDLYR